MIPSRAFSSRRGGSARCLPLSVASAWLLLVTLCFCDLARAHDPYETTTTVVVQKDRINVTMTMARRTAEELFLAKNVPARGAPWPHTVALEDVYVLTSGDARLSLRSAQVNEVEEGKDRGDFVFAFEYSRSSARSIRLRGAYLERLEQGYTGVVQVVEENSERLLDIKVLHSSDPYLELGTQAGEAARCSEQGGGAREPRMPHTRPFWMFLWIGVEHVVLGYDHLLFLFGALLACVGVRPALGVLTTFTLAHSVTLSLAALQIIPLVSGVVEPLIAASIFVLAFWGKELGANSLLLPMTFLLGLVHGLGFAAGLETLADAGGVRLFGLVGFNLGVELGQVTAAALLLPLLAKVRSLVRGERILHWIARGVGVIGAVIFAWRVLGWG